MAKSTNKKVKIGKRELKRLQVLNRYEDESRAEGFAIIAGVDEAGRGPLAGPVVAAACIIPSGIYIPYINDSKQLTAEERATLFKEITENPEIIFGIGIVDSIQIDLINIHQAGLQAMLIAIGNLSCFPHCILVDGMKLPHPTIPCKRIVKGDTLSQSIAAASVIAKVTRDAMMEKYHDQWPEYGFAQHKGYATQQHQKAIREHGPCPIHRRSFAPFKPSVESEPQPLLDLLI